VNHWWANSTVWICVFVVIALFAALIGKMSVLPNERTTLYFVAGLLGVSAIAILVGGFFGLWAALAVVVTAAIPAVFGLGICRNPIGGKTPNRPAQQP